MEFLIYLFLLVSVPVFYIVGLMEFVRLLSRRGRPTQALSSQTAAEQIRDHAATQSPAVAKALLEVAAQIEATAPVASGRTMSSGAIFEAVPGQAAEPGSTRPAAAASTGLNRDLGDVMHSLDNINVLLYLGAFLVVVSAGIFVGYNFETLSGTFKTVFLALFAAAFYGTGLVLFLQSKKLRPAGVTFTGVGLVLLPLVGLAAYNFTSLHELGPATWFVTSVLTLICYIFTLTITRQTYIAYLMAFTTLSIFESSVSLFNLPVHWFGWAMTIASIILLTLSRTKLLWEDARSSLMISANVFVPVALLLSYAATDENGLAQLGVTIGLAGLFYGAMVSRYHEESVGEVYWALALVSLPAALAVGLWPSLSRGGIALVMLGVCAAYLALEFSEGSQLKRSWRELLALITGLLPLGGLAVVYDRPSYVVAILAAAVLINAYLAWRLRQTGLALIAIISLLPLPWVYARVFLDPALPWSAVAAMLLAVAPALWWWSRRISTWPDSGREIGAFGYLAALALAIVAAWLSSPTALMVVAHVVTLALYGLSAIERRPSYLYAAAASFYLALLQPAIISGWGTEVTALILAAAGAAIYVLSSAAPSPRRAEALRYCGLIGPFLGAAVGLYQETAHVQPVLALAAGGGLLFVEARRQNQMALQEVAGGIIVLALNWYCAVINITETQAYTLPWAAYAAFLGYRRRSGGHEAYDGFVAAALAILTLPLASQALAVDGQYYGLLLIFESIALVFLGMALSYRFVTLWGAAVLVAEVLYQMRDFFYALPKYLISAGLGLALLAVAIVMLQRRKGSD